MKQMLTRLVLTLPVVWLVVSLVFLLIHLVPGDPILEMLGEGATPADIGACATSMASISRCGSSICTIGPVSRMAISATRSGSMTRWRIW